MAQVTRNTLEGDELYPLIVLYTLSQGYLSSTGTSTVSSSLPPPSSASTTTVDVLSSSRTTNPYTARELSSSKPVSPLSPTVPTEETVEDPTTHKKLLQWLTAYRDQNLITFGTLTHEPTRTSEESATVRGVTLDSGAKAMLLRSGKGIKIDSSLVSLSSTVTPSINSSSFTASSVPTVTSTSTPFILIILAASKQADLNKVKKLLGTKDLRMASVDEVKMVTGCIPGAVPPFGSLWSQPRREPSSESAAEEPVITIVDKSILTQGPTINFNAGLRTFSVINLSVNHYLSIENPLIGNFTK